MHTHRDRKDVSEAEVGAQRGAVCQQRLQRLEQQPGQTVKERRNEVLALPDALHIAIPACMSMVT